MTFTSMQLLSQLVEERNELIARPETIHGDPYDPDRSGSLDTLIDDTCADADSDKWNRYLSHSGDWFWAGSQTCHYLLPGILQLWRRDLNLDLTSFAAEDGTFTSKINDLLSNKSFVWKSCPSSYAAKARSFQRQCLIESAEALRPINCNPVFFLDDNTYRYAMSWVFQLLGIARYDNHCGVVIRQILQRSTFTAFSVILALCSEIVILCEPRIPLQWMVKENFRIPDSWIRFSNAFLSGCRVGLPSAATKSLVASLSNVRIDKCCRRLLSEYSPGQDVDYKECVTGIGTWIHANELIWKRCLSRFSAIL